MAHLTIFNSIKKFILRNLSLNDPKAWNPSLWQLAGSQSLSGENVTEESALTYSAVYNAISLIAGTIGSLPLHLMQRKGESKRIADDRKMYQVLHDQFNPWMTAMAGRECLTAHVLSWGNGYAEIVRNGYGELIELWPITPNRVRPEFREGTIVYRVTMQNEPDKILPREKILHIPGLGFDGFMGYSVISLARKSIGLGMAMESFGSLYFGKGTHPSAVIYHPNQLKDPKAFREAVSAVYSGLGNSNQLMVLEDGMKMEKVGIPPEDSQFLESRQFQIPEIARWFNLPPHKLKDLTRSSFCLPAEVEVYTQAGPKPIASILAGEKVWSLTNDKWKLSPVIRSEVTGIDEILTIKTTNRTLRCNAKHPLLSRVKINDQWKTRWVPAGELVRGDTIVTMKNLPESQSNIKRKNGEEITIDLMEFCGLLLGDGNVMKQNGKGKVTTIKDIFIREIKNNTRFNSFSAAQELIDLGFSGVARTKRIPDWVFESKDELKLGLLRGFLDADGSVDKKGRISFSSCNEPMLSQIRHLCMGLGIPVTNLRFQEGTTKLPNGKPKHFKQWMITCSDPGENKRIGSHTPEYVKRMGAGNSFDKKDRNYPQFGGKGFDSDCCGLARIIEIKKDLILQPVYDLAVQETHSFIANGLVVHNSNIESEQISYVRDSILPWLVRLEQNYQMQLLTPSDRELSGRGRLYWKHIVEGLLRGDSASRAAFYGPMLDKGVFSINEVRALEDKDPIPGGDIHLVPLNMTTLENAGKPQEPPSVRVIQSPQEPKPGNGKGNGKDNQPMQEEA